MTEIIFTDNQNIRLDKFLVHNFPEFSRSQWQKEIRAKGIMVNEKNTTPHYKLQANDKIKLYSFPTQKISKLPEVEIEILAAEKDYLIINKPAGLPVHPDHKYKTNTLIQQIMEKYPEIDKVETGDRPGIVQRLDKDVSGVMVIARTKHFFNNLKEQFQNHKIYKEYLTLVHGPLSQLEGEIKTRLERDKKTGKMKVRPASQPGKISITQYEVIKNFAHFAYLKIVIKTGRTHQIRTVLRSLDHPVVGDTLYAKKKTKAHLDVKRPFLHAYKLGFYNINNEWVEYEKELPEDLIIILNNLK